MAIQGSEAWEALILAFAALRLDASFPAGERRKARSGVSGWIEGVPVVVQVRSVPTVGDVLAFEQAEADDAYKVLVGRRLSAPVRAALIERDMGYFDGQGHLRLWRRPLLIDTDVDPVSSALGASRLSQFDVPSLLDVSLAVLDGVARQGVRQAAAALGRAPGTVSKQLAALRAAHLVDDRGEPAVPDLFDAVAEVWRPARIPLARAPVPGDGPVNDRLHLGLSTPDGPGWVLADAHAAAAWGAPVVLGGDAPPDFYVQDAQVVRLARTLLGDAEYGRHACTVARAPAPFVCRRRFDRGQTSGGGFFAPSFVVAALDLAADPGRGRETLELWSRNLPEDVRRVW